MAGGLKFIFFNSHQHPAAIPGITIRRIPMIMGVFIFIGQM